MKILITGVAGMIGSHLSRHLLEKGHTIIGIDNLSGGYREYVDSRVKFFELDLVDVHQLDRVFADTKPDYVYHLAAYAAEGLSPFIRNFNYNNNLICSVNVVNNCIRQDVKKIIFTSSMAVYGAGKAPFKESDSPSPADPYGIAKLAVEMDLKQAFDQFGLKYSIVRPHNVIGIYQNIWDKYRNVIGIWIRQTMSGKPITIFGDGNQTRAFTDVKYIMEALVKLMDIDCDVCNIGSDKFYTINEVADMFKAIGAKIVHIEERHEVKNAYCDHNKAKKVLGFNDKTNVPDLINDMFDWAKKEPDRKTKIMKYEIDKHMYESWKN